MWLLISGTRSPRSSQTPSTLFSDTSVRPGLLSAPPALQKETAVSSPGVARTSARGPRQAAHVLRTFPRARASLEPPGGGASPLQVDPKDRPVNSF